MKKFLLAIVSVFALGTTSAFAIENEPETGITFIGQFGMNISNFKGTVVETNAKPGFNFGARAEYVLPNCHGAYVNAGVLYTLKGAKNDFQIPTGGPADMTGTVKAMAYYVEIPIHVGFRYNINDLIGVYADLGPYFAIGTNGKTKTRFDSDLYRGQDSFERFFHKDNFGMQRFDCGFGYRIGAEYNQHYSLTLSMDWGITDMYTDDWRATHMGLDKMKNFNTSISFGYRF